ncbi:hypothetical protein NSB25_16515 [Acetatifactor muris]|uniref:hypothetical protein n=1 Tax=Acetatifactor muris TaxID=879566 RepID=UPI0011AF5EE6|nr:hypothetical protein [Acetatifactor muris]MCR2048874.1 hypothetical protein [Acetatifactor muris]
MAKDDAGCLFNENFAMLNPYSRTLFSVQFVGILIAVVKYAFADFNLFCRVCPDDLDNLDCANSKEPFFCLSAALTKKLFLKTMELIQ